MDNPLVELANVAQRATDIINELTFAHSWDYLKNKFVAIRLSDGGSDKVLYDNKRDAVRHQLHEQQCAYFCFRNVGPGGVTARDMGIFLNFFREAYRRGMRLVDPDDQFGGRELIMTTPQFDYQQARLAAAQLGLLTVPKVGNR